MSCVAQTPTAEEIVTILNLAPHPEGGYFRETFRDPNVLAPTTGPARAASTAIYFLLEEGQVSRWHTVDAAEAWHWYHGAPLRLSTAPGKSGPVTDTILGIDLKNGQRPQTVVPAGIWQQAQSLGHWSLVGCTVAPGFSFDGFHMAPADFRPE